jgi:hypothetical protein
MSPSPGRRAVTEFDKRRAANIRLTTGYLAIPVEQVGGLMRTVGLRALWMGDSLNQCCSARDPWSNFAMSPTTASRCSAVAGYRRVVGTGY